MKPASKTAVKLVGGVSTMSALVSVVALVGGAAAAGPVAALGVLLAALCWVLNDTGRSDRLVQVIHAVRGTSAPPPHEHDHPAIQPGGTA